MTGKFLKLLPLLSLFLVGTAAVAQDDMSDNEDEDATLEEVLVQATRRGEVDVMDTPVSITALSGELAEAVVQRDLNDIAIAVPGLSAGTVPGFASAQFSMRGVTESTIILYKEAPVQVTLDEFVVPHVQTANLEMFDIEAVEVLRGPQGTLFGKNTTGGVIAVRTKRPVLEENSFEFRAQAGSWGTTKGNAAVNLSLGDTLAFRFAGMYLNSDGYYKNNAAYGPIGAVLPFNTVHMGESGRGNGQDIGGDDLFSGRAKLLFSPTEDVNILFQYEFVRDDGDTKPLINESREGYVFPLWGFSAPTGDPIDFAGVTLRDDNFLKMSEGHRVDIDGFYVNLDWALTDNYTLYANAGTREQESRLPSTYGGEAGPISLFDATRDDNRDTSQIEARIGSNLDGPFNFTAGVFYQEDETEFCVMQTVGFLDGFFLGTPPDYFNNNPRVLCNRQDAEAKAIYFDGTYDVSDRFHVTAGLRYTDEEKAWAGRPMRFMLDGLPLADILNEPLDAVNFQRFPDGVVYNDHDWSEPTYRLILGYDFSDDLMGFFGYSRGFKSGGYNDQLGTQLDPITDLAAEPTEPEIADSLEGGIKYTFPDGRANIAVNAYYVEYSDAQRTFNVSFPGGGQETLFFNAADMTVWGVETEGTWALTDAFTLRYNVAYMDAEFDKFEADTDYDGIIDVDLGGQPVTRAPEWMGSVIGNYRQRLQGGTLDWSLSVAYEDSSIQAYSDVAPEYNTVLDERTLVDASVTWTRANSDLYVKLIGRNLGDERYRTGSLSVATLWIMSTYGPPRYYGIEIGNRFDF